MADDSTLDAGIEAAAVGRVRSPALLAASAAIVLATVAFVLSPVQFALGRGTHWSTTEWDTRVEEVLPGGHAVVIATDAHPIAEGVADALAACLAPREGVTSVRRVDGTATLKATDTLVVLVDLVDLDASSFGVYAHHQVRLNVSAGLYPRSRQDGPRALQRPFEYSYDGHTEWWGVRSRGQRWDSVIAEIAEDLRAGLADQRFGPAPSVDGHPDLSVTPAPPGWPLAPLDKLPVAELQILYEGPRPDGAWERLWQLETTDDWGPLLDNWMHEASAAGWSCDSTAGLDGKPRNLGFQRGDLECEVEVAYVPGLVRETRTGPQVLTLSMRRRPGPQRAGTRRD